MSYWQSNQIVAFIRHHSGSSWSCIHTECPTTISVSCFDLKTAFMFVVAVRCLGSNLRSSRLGSPAE